jgi:hypothetical protein
LGLLEVGELSVKRLLFFGLALRLFTGSEETTTEVAVGLDGADTASEGFTSPLGVSGCMDPSEAEKNSC